MRRSEWLGGLLLVGILASLAVLGPWRRKVSQPVCAADGGRIETAYRVRIVDELGSAHQFCSIRCGEMWLQAWAGRPQAIWVADEITGAELDARTAYFVRSLIVTSRSAGNRLHAFRLAEDAEEHARTCSGQVLRDGDRPFSQWLPKGDG
jgi:endogenous inhibitor of DNA gyrase (YacG/DUF329 family)